MCSAICHPPISPLYSASLGCCAGGWVGACVGVCVGACVGAWVGFCVGWVVGFASLMAANPLKHVQPQPDMYFVDDLTLNLFSVRIIPDLGRLGFFPFLALETSLGSLTYCTPAGARVPCQSVRLRCQCSYRPATDHPIPRKVNSCFLHHNSLLGTWANPNCF